MASCLELLASLAGRQKRLEATWSKTGLSPAGCLPHAVFGSNFVGGLPEGLQYWPEFITPEEESALVVMLDAGDWLTHLLSRKQQFFGLVYYHTMHDVDALQPGDDRAKSGQPMEMLPPWLLPRVRKTGAFSQPDSPINQVAANNYTGTNGISPHVEDPECFGPNLATLSLISPTQMALTRAPMEPVARDQDRVKGADAGDKHPARRGNGEDDGDWIKILLEPRSLMVMRGESRYAFKHGIRRSRLVELRDGSTVKRDSCYRRISFTFRELLASRRQLQDGGSTVEGG